jgi:RimJ/RimL family protein N-acetyltransferase
LMCCATACVRVEWSAFSPQFMRLRTRPGHLAVAEARAHKSIYVSRYRELQPSDGRVSLDRFDNPETAIDIVARRYEHLKSENPRLARTLSAASPEELREWYDADQLRAIRTNATIVGVLAITPSEIGWIEDDEVIDADHNGRGYAAAAQSAWADQVTHDRNTLLISTIHDGNDASRKTAESVGRRHVLDDYIVALR